MLFCGSLIFNIFFLWVYGSVAFIGECVLCAILGCFGHFLCNFGVFGGFLINNCTFALMYNAVMDCTSQQAVYNGALLRSAIINLVASNPFAVSFVK